MKYRMFWVTTVLLMMFGWNWMLEGGDAWRGWSQKPWVDGDGMEIAIRSSAEDQLAVVGTTGDSLTAAEKPAEKPAEKLKSRCPRHRFGGSRVIFIRTHSGVMAMIFLR